MLSLFGPRPNRHKTSSKGELIFVPESGFSGSGDIVDGGSFIITGSGFGTKPQAAAKVFDQFDRYINNGVVETPYSALNDGDLIPLSSANPYGGHSGIGAGFTAESSAAYGRRSKGYKSPVDAVGGVLDYWMQNWRGWPDPEGEKIYLRWYFMVNERPHGETALDGALSGGATLITVTPAVNQFIDASTAPLIVIELDNGSLHRTVLSLPKLSDTTATLGVALPSAAASGKPVYFSHEESGKFIRIRDTSGGAVNLHELAWTWDITTTAAGGATNNQSDTVAIPSENGASIWNLLEVECFFPTAEADKANGVYSLWLNGSQIGSTITGDFSDVGGTWPFPGQIPRLIGMDAAGPSVWWKLPNNWIQFAELYADTTTQRIEIADHATVLRSSIIREVCPITGWVDGQLDLIINQGRHGSLAGQQVYQTDDTNVETLLGHFSL